MNKASEDGTREPKKQAARPRTAEKKVTLPKTVKKTLAENAAWKSARP
ncbi:hypothetical protein ABT258_27235 [Streptomyces tendae]